MNFRHGVRHREHARALVHARDHLARHHARRAHADEHIRPAHRVGQRAGDMVQVRLAAHLFVRGVQSLHALADDAEPIHHNQIFYAEVHQMLADGHARASRAVDDHLCRLHRLADNFQRVEQRRRNDNRRPVLVVVEDGNVADFLQLALHLKAARRGDIFQIDAAETAGNQVDGSRQLVHVLRAHAQRERVHAREFLEQHAFAFHHRHARLRADVAQAEDRRAIRNHGDHVRPPREQIALFVIIANRETRLGHARRVCEREFFAVGDMGSRRDFQLTLPFIVLFQRFLPDIHQKHPFFRAAAQTRLRDKSLRLPSSLRAYRPNLFHSFIAKR